MTYLTPKDHKHLDNLTKRVLWYFGETHVESYVNEKVKKMLAGTMMLVARPRFNAAKIQRDRLKRLHKILDGVL